METDSGFQARAELAALKDELVAELNLNNMDRLAAFGQLVADPELSAEEKFALAVTSWLQGGQEPSTKLPQALSMYRVPGGDPVSAGGRRFGAATHPGSAAPRGSMYTGHCQPDSRCIETSGADTAGSSHPVLPRSCPPTREKNRTRPRLKTELSQRLPPLRPRQMAPR